LKPQKLIMKVAGCRTALYPLRTEHITLGNAYSDTAAAAVGGVIT